MATTMMKDCHAVFEFTREWLKENGFTGSFIVMGRSLGSASALELASRKKDSVDGLIVESGFAWTGPLLELLGINIESIGFTEEKGFKNMEKMDSGYEEVPTWNGKEWIEDTDCGFDEVYGINFDSIKRYETRGLHWAEDDGKMLKWSDGFDAYVAYLRYYGNVASERPNSHFRIKNLAQPLF